MTREEAIRDIKECVMPYVGGISLQMAIDDMTEMDRLSKATPVLKEPERPHGEWKKDGFFAICSECGHELQHYELVVSRLNFCPNCGADMRKEGEAE